MTEQCSSACNNFIALLNEDKCALPLFPSQQSNAFSRMISRESINPVQIGPHMRLDECMDSIANVSGIENPMEARMGCIFRHISTANMTQELLNDMFDNYADLLKINFVIIPWDEYTPVNPQHIRVFIGAPGAVDGQRKYKHRAFILYDHRRQMFAPLYVSRTDNSQQVRFDENNLENIGKNICEFIEKWNRQKTQSSASTMNNNRSDNDPITKGANSCEINNNATSFSSASTVDKGVFVPASEAIKTSLESAWQMVTLKGYQLDNIQLKQKSISALLDHFNGLPDKEKIQAIYDEMIFVTESLRMATTPDHEEVGENLSLNIEKRRYCQDKTKREQPTFIVPYGNHTARDPLFSVDFNGQKRTVSPSGDVNGISEIIKHVDPFNLLDFCPYLTLQGDQMLAIDQNAFNDMEVDDVSRPPIESMTDIFDSSSSAMGISTSGNKPIGGTIETNDAPTTSDLIELLAQESGILTDTAQSGGSNRVRAGDQISSDPQASSSTHLRDTTQTPQTTFTSSSTKTILRAPKIKTQPDREWHIRYFKELMPNGKKRIVAQLLQGVGGNGTRIGVEVPLRGERKMYLAATTRTVNNQYHFSKLLALKGTKVNTKRFNRENRLNYLKFNGCDPKHFFDPNTRIVYLEITPKEHARGLKEVPVYMFNLYQNQRLTKAMIEREQLDKCKLAFWLCVKENENYIPISDESLSEPITEKK